MEESIERDGSVHLIVNDGMHRVYMALREWVIPHGDIHTGNPQAPAVITRIPCRESGVRSKNETTCPTAS